MTKWKGLNSVSDLQNRMVYELIPSTGKAEGWTNCRLEYKNLMDANIPTSERLLRLHELATSPATTQPIPTSFVDAFEWYLYISDRNDVDEKAQAFRERMEIRNSLLLPWQVKSQFDQYKDMLREFAEICKEGTEVTIDTIVSGKLRSYGTRTINGQGPETVYASHQCIYPTEREKELMEQGNPILPTSFYGLSLGLDKVYERFCAKYDEAVASSKNLDDRIQAEAFFQVLGTRSIHPAWDGNGRAFLAHLGYTLEQVGIPIEEYKIMEQFVPGLTRVTDELVRQNLSDAGLTLISGDDYFKMEFNPAFRRQYMKKLKQQLTTIIDHGTDKEGPHYELFYNGWWQIKRVLIDNDLVEPSEEDKKILKMMSEFLATLPEDQRDPSRIRLYVDR